MKLKGFYSIAEVARMIGKDRRTVQRMVREGQLDVVQIGKRWCIPLSSLQARADVWESILFVDAYDPHDD